MSHSSAHQRHPDHAGREVWSYEEPYDEQADLAQRVAFDTDRFPVLHLQVGD